MGSEPEVRRPPVAGVAAVVIAAVVLSVFLIFGNKDVLRALGAGLVPEVAGAIAGNAVLVTLLAWIALYFLFYRKSGTSRGNVALLTVFISCVAVNAVGLALLDRALRGSATADREQQRIADAEIDAAKADLLAGRPIDLRVKAKGDAGEMERVSKQMFDAVDRARHQYKNALAATGYPQFLAPQQFKSDPGFVRTKAKLARDHDALGLYRKQLASIIPDARANVLASRMNDDEKTQMIAGLEKSQTEGTQQQGRILDLEDAIFTELRAKIDVLADARGKWIVSGNTVKFYDTAALSAYQAHIRKIQDLAEQERGLQEDARARAAAVPNLGSRDGN